MNRRQLVVALIVLLILLASIVGGLIIYTNNVNSQIQNNNSNNPPVVTNESSYKIVSKTESDETSTYTINIKYPTIENYSDKKVQDSFNAFITNVIAQFEKGVKSTTSTEGKNTLEYDYEVFYQGDRFVSILMSGSEYTGGVHPTPVLKAINYDLKENKEIKLVDLATKYSLAYEDKISMLASAELEKKLGQDFIEEGVAADLENFREFNFNKTILKITFSAYQVGPYAIGTPSVEIPLAKLSEFLKSEFK